MNGVCHFGFEGHNQVFEFYFEKIRKTLGRLVQRMSYMADGIENIIHRRRQEAGEVLPQRSSYKGMLI